MCYRPDHYVNEDIASAIPKGILNSSMSFHETDSKLIHVNGLNQM